MCEWRIRYSKNSIVINVIIQIRVLDLLEYTDVYHTSGWRNFFPINAPGMGRLQLLNLGGLGYGLELRFWVVIAIIVSLTLTITLITTLTII